MLAPCCLLATATIIVRLVHGKNSLAGYEAANRSELPIDNLLCCIHRSIILQKAVNIFSFVFPSHSVIHTIKLEKKPTKQVDLVVEEYYVNKWVCLGFDGKETYLQSLNTYKQTSEYKYIMKG